MSFEFNGHIIKAISIQQPYANLIINGIKNIENRTRKIKLDVNPCKNWLFVHSTSKPISTQKLIIISNMYIDIKIEPTSSIIGMIHIHDIKKKNILDNGIWAIGPYCWYIDAIIKFKNPIKTIGRMGQGLIWNPSENLHKEIYNEIKISMYNISQIDDIEFIIHNDNPEEIIYYVKQRGKYMTWEDVIKSLIDDIDTFKYKLIRVLLSIEYKAYFWECDKIILKNPFRFAIFDSKTLSERKQDTEAFKGKIKCSKNVISFLSLDKEILLICPCHKTISADYTSLATFSRTVSIKQQCSFWKKVGKSIKEGDWVSTSGLGVSWLHIRVSSKPKYYHPTFLNGINNSRLNMEKYIENFKFPQDFINMIVISNNWKSEMQLDLITYYFELLPKNTTLVFGRNKILKLKADEVKLKTNEIYTDWKKHGRFAAIKRNEDILEKEKPHLITFFGDTDFVSNQTPILILN